jgi:hypothetical protein
MTRLILLFVMTIFATGYVYAQEATTTPACPEGYICTISNTDSKVDTNANSTTKVESPPPSAIAPNINSANSDLCTVGVSGAVQTQILGISAGKTVRDMNCEKLKNAKTLYDMGMKVAAVSVMCGDPRVFEAMMMAGTPCPFDGMIGTQARAAWEENPELQPGAKKEGMIDEELEDTLIGGGVIGGLLLLLLL